VKPLEEGQEREGIPPTLPSRAFLATFPEFPCGIPEFVLLRDFDFD
jgi:hypothetical protein